MDIKNLTYHCSSCDEWFTKKSIPRTELDEEEFVKNDRLVDLHFCTCGGPVYDAHETNTVTPYGELELEILKEQVNVYESAIYDLNCKMTNIDGQRR